MFLVSGWGEGIKEFAEGCFSLGFNLTFDGQQDFNEDTNEGICMEIQGN